MPRYLNDGSADAPKLRIYLNLDNLIDLQEDSLFPSGLDDLARDKRLDADRFEGVQLTNDSPPGTGSFLPFCGLDRISTPAEADAIALKHAIRGDECLTVHAGWGIEDDDEVCRIVEAILTASERHRIPIFLETHRATITQDMWRTVQITKRFPEVRFNGDFSHYYCGQEMVYGGMEMKLAFMEPIFSRVGFLHGRIASPGNMQVPIGPDPHTRPVQAHGEANYLADFLALWTHAMSGFLRSSGVGDILIFAPELLAGTHYYSRLFPSLSGKLIEESDRYAQALLYCDLARSCFASAQSQI